MSKEGLKLPSEWEDIDNVIIYDPDGWDRKNFDVSWNTPIDYDEWTERMTRSTIKAPKHKDRPVEGMIRL